MPVKKTTEKKPAVKKTVSKPVNKTVEVKTAKVTKPQVVVETKKIDNHSCWSDCKCEWWCPCGCCMKWLILVLVFINLVLSVVICIRNCNRNAWTIEMLKDGWKENMEKAIEIYESNYYIDAQTQSISSYASQLAADNQAAAE